MKTFETRVAVITGGASGLGRALAFRFAREGVKIALADVDEGALGETKAALTAAGGDAIAHGRRQPKNSPPGYSPVCSGQSRFKMSHYPTEITLCYAMYHCRSPWGKSQSSSDLLAPEKPQSRI
jgi:hypothetical protein